MRHVSSAECRRKHGPTPNMARVPEEAERLSRRLDEIKAIFRRQFHA